MPHMNTPPTPKHIRVTVPVSPEVLELFQRFSRLSGQSVGRSMASWLQETKDGIVPMMEILQHHKQAPMKAIRSLQDYAGTLNNLTGDLFDRVASLDKSPADLRALAQLSEKTTQAISNARAKVSGAGPGRLGDTCPKTASDTPKRGLTPPFSNTGGKGTKATKRSMGGAK